MDLAIVGAGVAGAAAAYELRAAPVDVTVFERSDSVGGRAATGTTDECLYDHGANYVKAGSERVSELVTEELSTDGLVDVEAPVWTFDESGEITPGDDRDDHKWTYESGIDELSRRLFAKTDADVEFEKKVARLTHSGGTWWLLDDVGTDLGTFDGVLLTPPAPQTAELLDATKWDDEALGELRAAANDVCYRRIYTVLLHYPFAVEYPWYGLVNTDRDHPVGWLSREELKDGHVPDGGTLFVVQMAPDWSAYRFDAPAGTVRADVADRIADLLDDGRFADPDWSTQRRWRDALPNGGVDVGVLREAERSGLFFAGDWVAGDGRVHLAVESGLEAGERTADFAGSVGSVSSR